MKDKQRKVFFRADGNSSIGLGHVIRSLALADMLSDNFDCHFIIQNPLPTLKKQILEVCNSIICLEEQSNLESEAEEIASDHLNSADVIVLDGYNFKTEYQRIFKKRDIKVVCIDDIHSYHFVADVIINHALEVDIESYSTEKYSKIHHGFKYCLLRKPFLEASQQIRKKQSEHDGIFVCFGGADGHNMTLKTLKAITSSDVEIKRVDIVLGAANCFKLEIEDYVSSLDSDKFRVYSNLSGREICALMLKNTIGVVPASTISMECFATQLEVICGYFIENQEPYYNSLLRNNMITGMGDYRISSVANLSKSIKLVANYRGAGIRRIDGSIKERYEKIFSNLTGQN